MLIINKYVAQTKKISSIFRKFTGKFKLSSKFKQTKRDVRKRGMWEGEES